MKKRGLIVILGALVLLIGLFPLVIKSVVSDSRPVDMGFADRVVDSALAMNWRQKDSAGRFLRETTEAVGAMMKRLALRDSLAGKHVFVQKSESAGLFVSVTPDSDVTIVLAARSKTDSTKTKFLEVPSVKEYAAERRKRMEQYREHAQALKELFADTARVDSGR